MKNLKLYSLLIAVFVACCFSSCEDDKPSVSGEVVLSGQAQLNAFQYSSGIQSVIIQGEDVTDLSSLAEIKVLDKLVLRNTGLSSINLPDLSSLRVLFELSENENLSSLGELPNLKFMGGNIIIDGNPALTDISGLSSLKFLKGDLIISNNILLGEDKDCAVEEGSFCVLQELWNAGVLEGDVVLTNNHPKSVSDVTAIGSIARGEGYLDYVLTSQAAVDAFVSGKDTIGNLTLRGRSITYIGSIAEKIKVIKGVVTIENTSLHTTEGFFELVKCDSSIIIKDNAKLNNPNGFKNYTRVNGNLEIINNPVLPFNWAPDAFTKIDSVFGNVIIRDNILFNSGGLGLQKLVYVEGNFEISGCGGDLWNLGSMNPGLRYVGGDIVYERNQVVNSLNGFQYLEYVGGDTIIVRDNGGISLYTNEAGPGFCLIKEKVAAGVISAQTILLRQNGSETYINFRNLTMCDGSQAPDYPSFTFNTQGEIDNWNAPGDTIQNLIIDGQGINYIGSIAEKVKVVQGDIHILNTSLPTTEGFFDQVKFNGSVVLKNNSSLNNPNGFKNVTVIKGDLVLEDLPQLPFNWAPDAFTKIDSIYGDVIIRNCPQFIDGGLGLKSLVYVGGDFEVHASGNAGNKLWNFTTMSPGLDHIGGNLIIEKNEFINSLGGLDRLSFIGGDSIIIRDNGGIANESGGNGPGFCRIKEYFEDGVIQNPNAVIILKRNGEDPVDFSTLGRCN